MEAPDKTKRARWVKPALVEKPLDETRSGFGTHADGLPDFQS